MSQVAQDFLTYLLPWLKLAKFRATYHPGAGVLTLEFTAYVRPAMRAPSAANCEKSTHHRCKIYVEPTHNGQKLGHFEGK